MQITQITPYEVLDSRGTPTVQVDVETSSGACGSAVVPSGASVGSLEAFELRDGDPTRYHGKGVLKALASIRDTLAPELIGLTVTEQQNIDDRMLELDGSENKQNLGANALLGLSLAVARAAAQARGVPLYMHINDLCGNPSMFMPVPMMNVLNGGAHANNNLDLQEFMLIPVGTSSFAEALRCGVEVFQSLKKGLNEQGMSTSVGDEGGFAPNLQSNGDAMDLLESAVRSAGYKPIERVCFALDCAATEYCTSPNTYALEGENASFDRKGMVQYLVELCDRFPGIVSIEDGLAEDDFVGWQLLSTKLRDSVQLVGDDIFVTNIRLLEKGIAEGVGNSILIKLNQIGTLSETIAVISKAHSHGYTTVVSHRSGDTEDTFIADLAVGSGAGQIKTGSLSRSERVAKYNALLRIEANRPDIEYRGRREFSRFKN